MRYRLLAVLLTVGLFIATALAITSSLRQAWSPFSGHVESVYSLAFSLDGKILASGSCGQAKVMPIAGQFDFPVVCIEGEIRLWDVATGQLLGQPLAGHQGLVTGLAFRPDGKMLASIASNGTIRLWDLATRQQVGPALSTRNIVMTQLAFSPDSTLLASASNELRLWTLTSSPPVGQRLVGHSAPVAAVAFSPDGKTLVAADTEIRLWDVARRRPIATPLRGHTSPVTHLAFSSDGKLLASIGQDNFVRVWDTTTSRSLDRFLVRGRSTIHTLKFPQYKQVLLYYAGHHVGTWDPTGG